MPRLEVPSRGAHEVLTHHNWVIARVEVEGERQPAMAVYTHKTEERGQIAILARDTAVPYSAVRWIRTYPNGGVLRSDTLASLETHLIYDNQRGGRNQT